MFRLVAACVISMSIALFAAGRAAADHEGVPTFTTNIYFNCLGDSNIGVPDGHRLVLRLGWRAKTRGLVEQFLVGIQTLASVEGVAVPSASQYWGEPRELDDGSWVVTWLYDTGRVVELGDSPFAVGLSLIARHPILDGLTFDGEQSHRPLLGAGDLLQIADPCLVTPFAL